MPSPSELVSMRPLLMGQCAGAIHDVLPAKQIIDDMVSQCVKIIHSIQGKIHKVSKL
jgi:hypothetical protein